MDKLQSETSKVMRRTFAENAELLIEKDKTIQLLANALKEAADYIENITALTERRDKIADLYRLISNDSREILK